MKESDLRLRFVRATRYHYANRASCYTGRYIGIPGRIRTRNARSVFWHDFRFTTGIRSPWQIMKDQGVATATGFEPAPAIVTGWCSTVELHGQETDGSRERIRTSTWRINSPLSCQLDYARLVARDGFEPSSPGLWARHPPVRRPRSSPTETRTPFHCLKGSDPNP